MSLIAESQSFIMGFALFLIIAGLIYLDKRNGFRVFNSIRNRVVNILLRLQQYMDNKEKKEEKLATE